MRAVAPHAHVAPVVGADVLDDRQPEAGPPGGARAGGVHAVEALEDARLLRLGDPRPLVGHGDLDGAVVQPRPDADRGARVGVGDGIADEVAHSRDEHVLVAPDVEFLGDLVGQGDVLGPGLEPQVLQGEGDDVLDVDERGVLQHGRALEPGEFDDLADQARQTGGLALHAPREAVDGLRVVLGVHDRLGEQGDAADGGLQLVADVGHEVTAGLLDPAPLGLVVDEQQEVAHAERRHAGGDVGGGRHARPVDVEVLLTDHAVSGDLLDHRLDRRVDEPSVAHQTVGHGRRGAGDDPPVVVQDDPRRAEHGEDVTDASGHLGLGLRRDGPLPVAHRDRSPHEEGDEQPGSTPENCRGRWLHVTESTSQVGHAGTGP